MSGVLRPHRAGCPHPTTLTQCPHPSLWLKTVRSPAAARQDVQMSLRFTFTRAGECQERVVVSGLQCFPSPVWSLGFLVVSAGPESSRALSAIADLLVMLLILFLNDIISASGLQNLSGSCVQGLCCGAGMIC